MTVIPNAVDAEDFSFGGAADDSLREQLGLQGAQVLVTWVPSNAYEG